MVIKKKQNFGSIYNYMVIPATKHVWRKGFSLVNSYGLASYVTNSIINKNLFIIAQFH